MANDLRSQPEPRVTSLVTGIVDDAQELFKQQVALLKHEVKEEIRQAKEGARSLALGVGLLLIGGFLLCLMLPLLLNWALNDTLPLWACFGIVGGFLAAIGGGLTYAGTRKLETIEPVPQSVEALQENLQLKP